MKKLLSLILICALVLSGCAQIQGNSSDESPDNDGQEAITKSIPSDDTEVNTDVKNNGDNRNDEKTDSPTSGEIPIAEGEDADRTPYEYEVDFDSLNDSDLLTYVKDNLYEKLVGQLDSDDYFVENVEAVYVSQEYIDELTFNSQSNIFFGYTLAELDEEFQGTRYVFTLGDEGDTIVTAFEDYDDTYEQVIKNVAIGTGVILICVSQCVKSNKSFVKVKGSVPKP